MPELKAECVCVWGGVELRDGINGVMVVIVRCGGRSKSS
jgi:hypothetical protein